ncbi:hypothetical protein O3M35_002747 [Rhynocoris fuscipes]|uniref:Nuclear pore complex protein Nup153 n=1 Tax=Rhynocoris fuscipes TaxID=488301 RepID=A0AAW1CNZ1_9HEMI
MAKGNNTGKTKRSYSYKPYDASNSSLVKRLTNKVSEILPSPTWISRWLPSTSQVNARSDGIQDDDEEEDEEEIRQQPPVKRIRLQTALHSPQLLQHNHCTRISDAPENAEELSPISRVDHRDGAIAGPSGLQIHRSNFVSSTPATTQTISFDNKINQGDDGSDSGDSTSCCSSASAEVQQAERSSANTSLPKLATDSYKTYSPGAVRKLSSSKDKFSKLNLSASNSRPTFDSYVFHNPHNKSLNSSRSSQVDDSSPFYRGRTMFGGASANRESLNSSILSPASRPRVTNVRPISRQVPERDTIGSSALRILRALEQISTPVTEAKKMPINETPTRQRKTIQPFDELIIPQMPAILRIKRKKRNESENNSSSMTLNATKDITDNSATSASSTMVNISMSAGDPASIATNSSTLPQTKQESAASKQSSYTLRKEDSDKGDKFVTSIKGRANETLENERLPEVNLPNVKLSISSLPVFSLPTANKIVVTQSSLPDSTVLQQRTSNISTAPFTSSSTSSSNEPSTISTSSSSIRPIIGQFKFSEPIVQHIDDNRITNIKTSYKFSNPLDVDSLHKEKQNKTATINKTVKENNGQSLLKEDTKKRYPLDISSASPNSKLKRKSSNDERGANVLGTKLSSNSFDASSLTSDSLKTNTGMNGNKSKLTLITSSSDSNKNKTTMKTNLVESTKSTESMKTDENKWSCCKCSLENNNTDRNCLKCGLVKVNSINVSSSKDKPELTDMIQCKICFSSYKASDKKCLSCTTEKTSGDTTNASSTTNVTSSTSSAAELPLSALFKKSAGSWECSECLVSNKGDVDTCVACSTPKPGVQPKANAQSTPTFSFGIPPSASASNTVSAAGFKFGIEHSTANDTASSDIGGFKFNFGSKTSTNSSNTVSVQEFKFGSFPSTSKESEIKSTEESSKKEDSKEVSEAKSSLTTNKMFTFGGNSDVTDKQNEKKEDEKPNKDVKKVTFSQQLVEEKTISTDTITNTPSSFSFVTSTKSDTQSSTTFSFSKSTPLLGNVNTPSSTTETDKPAVSSSLFKFGSPFTGATTSVASSTAASSTPSSDSTVSVSSSLVTSSNNDKSSSTFSFLPNNAPKPPIFSSTVDTEKKDNTAFNNNKTTFGNSIVASSSGFTFNCPNDNKINADKHKIKEPTTNNFFATNRDTSTPNLITIQSKNDEKPNFFASTASSSTAKSDNKMFFASTSSNKTTGAGIFGSNTKPEEWKAKSTFGTENFDTKPSVTPFGSTTSSSLMTNSTERKSEPFTFNATANQSNTNISPFIFKGADTNDNKPSGGFTFHATAPPTGNSQQIQPNIPQLFGATTQQPQQQQQQPQPTTNLFGSSSTTLFNAGGSQPNNSAATPSFTFGAQSQPQQAIFGFSAPSQVPSAGTGTMSEAFQFGSQNALPPAQGTPALSGPPTFDPNIKPNFNFSGGATAPPTFSAQSSGLPSATPTANKERKIRKAVRRTLR